MADDDRNARPNQHSTSWGGRATFAKRDAPEKKLQEQEDSLNDVERQPEIAQANTTDVDEDLKASQMGREALEVKIASL
ncbi:hypothetical protein CDV36_016479 [Fusarium kuroshium]|uniref:Uncharacterized protein n=1 Tax=Fusarium kuroshium TaxID=2010991 RepID=A0A3M2QMU3_9HYPO|nr:hypothetical protein CDV36_016479 [Fusarium kuroshium]